MYLDGDPNVTHLQKSLCALDDTFCVPVVFLHKNNGALLHEDHCKVLQNPSVPHCSAIVNRLFSG